MGVKCVGPMTARQSTTAGKRHGHRGTSSVLVGVEVGTDTEANAVGVVGAFPTGGVDGVGS